MKLNCESGVALFRGFGKDLLSTIELAASYGIAAGMAREKSDMHLRVARQAKRDNDPALVLQAVEMAKGYRKSMRRQLKQIHDLDDRIRAAELLGTADRAKMN